jgi:hypothetical protein
LSPDHRRPGMGPGTRRLTRVSPDNQTPLYRKARWSGCSPQPARTGPATDPTGGLRGDHNWAPAAAFGRNRTPPDVVWTVGGVHPQEGGRREMRLSADSGRFAASSARPQIWHSCAVWGVPKAREVALKAALGASDAAGRAEAHLRLRRPPRTGSAIDPAVDFRHSRAGRCPPAASGNRRSLSALSR